MATLVSVGELVHSKPVCQIACERYVQVAGRRYIIVPAIGSASGFDCVDRCHSRRFVSVIGGGANLRLHQWPIADSNWFTGVETKRSHQGICTSDGSLRMFCEDAQLIVSATSVERLKPVFAVGVPETWLEVVRDEGRSLVDHVRIICVGIVRGELHPV